MPANSGPFSLETAPEKGLHPFQRAGARPCPRVHAQGGPWIQTGLYAHRRVEERHLGTPARLGRVGPHGEVDLPEPGLDSVLDGLRGDGGRHAVLAPSGIVPRVVKVETL